MKKTFIKNANFQEGVPESGRLGFKQEFAILKINQIDGNFRSEEFKIRERNYDWEYLKESIDKQGLISIVGVYKVNQYHIHTVGSKDSKYEYMCQDGNHRLFILKESFGEEYEVPCNIIIFKDDKEKYK